MLRWVRWRGSSSRLLADDVEERLTLLLLDHPSRPLESGGELGGILHALTVSARGAAHHLVVRGWLERGEGHGVRLDRPALTGMRLHGTLHGIPRAVVEDDEERGKIVGARDEVGGG